jgi:hypothetical protein
MMRSHRPTDPTNSRICRNEGVARPYTYALTCMRFTIVAPIQSCVSVVDVSKP